MRFSPDVAQRIIAAMHSSMEENVNSTALSEHHLDRALVWRGFKQLAPIALFVMAFGAAFGLAASQAGLSDTTIIVMSTAMFAGAAQFAALDVWGEQIPLAPLLLTVFAINARHLLMGASLYPWLRHLPAGKRYGIMMVASDANWALAMQAFSRGLPGLGILFGGGLALWASWILGSGLGVALGATIGNPHTWGLDMVMGCFLLAMVAGGEKDRQTLYIWAVAALSSLLAWAFLPENSHVIIGALAGGIAGVVLKEKKHA